MVTRCANAAQDAITQAIDHLTTPVGAVGR